MSDRDWSAYAKSTYQWEPGHKLHLRMTKSSLTSDFDYCPKSYEYKRIHRLPEPSTDDMTRGTNVHDAIEQYYINLAPLVQKAAAALPEKPAKAMAILQEALPVPDEPYTLGEEPIIQKRLDWDLARLQSDGVKNFLPIINELEVHAYAEETIEFNGEEITIPIHYAGSIDRGFRTDEDTIAIMELKTGKFVQKLKKDKWETDRYKVQSMRTEMAFYKYLLEKANHNLQDVTHWGWVYPAGSTKVLDKLDKYGYEQRSIDNITYESCLGRNGNTYKKKIIRMRDALLTAYLTSNFPPKASVGKCAWCSFKSICPEWGGSDNPQEYLENYEEEK